MSRLPTLGMGRTLNKDAAQYPKLPTPSKPKEAQDATDPYAVRGLSMSREEEWVRQYLAKRRGYWQQQKQFGRKWQPRNTSADFYSEFYKAVIQMDGAYFHDPKAALDEMLNSVMRQRGYRVYRFRYPSFDYVTKNFPRFYNERFLS